MVRAGRGHARRFAVHCGDFSSVINAASELNLRPLCPLRFKYCCVLVVSLRRPTVC